MLLQQIIKPFSALIPESNRFERIWILAKFDFKSRYYYHQLGVLWALIRPLFEFAIYYIVFTVVFSSGIPNYALYLFLGLILWYFFVEGTNKGIHVLQNKRYLIENISFNRSDLFISNTFSAFLGFIFNFLAYIALSIILGVFPTSPYVLLFPILMLNLFIMTMGFSLILATLSIYLKDIQHLWDMLVLAGLWLTPILYDKQLIVERAPSLLFLHPLTGIIINIREVVLYSRPPDYTLLIHSLVYGLAVFAIGYWLFTRYSHKAAEKL